MKRIHCNRCDRVMEEENCLVYPAIANTETFVIRTNFYDNGKLQDMCQNCKRSLLARALENLMVAL